MKILIDVNDNKAAFFWEILQNFKFLRATKITEAKADFIKGIKQAVSEVKAAKKGEIETTSLNDFLNELPD